MICGQFANRQKIPGLFCRFLEPFFSVVSHFSSLYGIEQRVKKSPSAESTDLPVKAASSLILTHRASKSALYLVTVVVWLSPLQNTISVKWVPFVRNLSTATTQESASPRAKCVTSTRTVLMEKTRASSVVRFCFCCFFKIKSHRVQQSFYDDVFDSISSAPSDRFL